MNKAQALKVLRLMMTSRAVEEREGILLRQGKSWMQVPCAGHEGLMALVCQLEADDYLFSYYRGYHLRLAKGIGVDQLAKDFFVQAGSSSGGRSMSVHCHSRELNVFPDAAPVASQCLPAAGVAWGQKRRNSIDITLCSIGDGSTRQGEFYEAICFAVQEQLPIIFLVEDNGYGISTNTQRLTPLSLGVFAKNIIQEVDGRNANEVFRVGKRTIEKVRSGAGPRIMWCHVDRLKSHTLMEDQSRYRDAEELAALSDPIQVLTQSLIDKGTVQEDEITVLEAEVQQHVSEVYERVEQQTSKASQARNSHALERHLFAPVSANTNPIKLADAKRQPVNSLTAFNETLRLALDHYPEVLLMGQDIEDPKGGVFGLTAGLSTEFPERVINSPIAEATILGAAIGLSFQGYKPICEIQFIDFIGPGFSQINTHIGNLSWRSMGEWQCPIVMYAPYGAYLPAGGLWHSESNEAWWTHIPGLRVAIPSSPEDSAGLLATALEENSPTLLLLPKHLLRVDQQVGEYPQVPFGKAKRVREGGDLTIVSWGNCVEVAQSAAEIAMQQANFSAEIIDLRTLVPCDWQTVEQSLRKTGRLIVVHEDNKTSGFGATIVAEMLTKTECFELLWTAPRLVARDDLPIPYSPELEHAVLPSVDDVVHAINAVCGKDTNATRKQFANG